MQSSNRAARREKREIARDLRKSSTFEEDVLWQELRRNQLDGFHFRRQHVLAGFIVDFYCHKARLVVELDGKHHLDQREADQERDNALKRMGNVVLRFPNALIRQNPAEVLARIREMAGERTQPGVPLPRSGEGVRGWG
jgi:very-short-patch-repair endonuclease